MALVHTGYQLEITVTDSGGNKSKPVFQLASADMATALTDSATIVADYAALTDGLITRYSVSDVLTEDTSEFAAAGVQIENVALITARLESDKEKYTTIRIPAPKATMFMATSGKNANVVNPSFAALQTFLGLASGSSNLFTVSDGEKLFAPGTAGVVTGKRIHRASRKG